MNYYMLRRNFRADLNWNAFVVKITVKVLFMVLTRILKQQELSMLLFFSAIVIQIASNFMEV